MLTLTGLFVITYTFWYRIRDLVQYWPWAGVPYCLPESSTTLAWDAKHTLMQHDKFSRTFSTLLYAAPHSSGPREVSYQSGNTCQSCVCNHVLHWGLFVHETLAELCPDESRISYIFIMWAQVNYMLKLRFCTSNVCFTVSSLINVCPLVHYPHWFQTLLSAVIFFTLQR